MITRNREVSYTVQLWAVPRPSYAITEEEPERFRFEARINGAEPYQEGAVKIMDYGNNYVEVPEGIDLNVESAKVLEEAIKKERLESLKRVMVLEQQLKELLALPNHS